MSCPPKLTLKPLLKQKLFITQGLLQALEILQMPQLELAQWLREEIEKNPLLELETTLPKSSHQEIPSLPSLPSLYDHIMNQIRESFPLFEEQELAKKIFEELDEKGFIARPLKEISIFLKTPLEKIETIVAHLQTFDPPGIFASHLQESLLLQLRAKKQVNTVSYRIIENHFNDLLAKKFKKIQKEIYRNNLKNRDFGKEAPQNVNSKRIPLAERQGVSENQNSEVKPMQPKTDSSGCFGISESEFKSALQILSHLNFRPTDIFYHEPVPLAKADLCISKIGKTWVIETIEEEWPRFKFHEDYLSLNIVSKEEKESLHHWTQSAHSIFRFLKRRQQLLIEIGTFLVHKQKKFLDQTGQLKPLKIQDLATHLGLHESTISRALAGKYAITPRGFLPLHSLFCISPLAASAKQILQQLIDQEDKENPMTDAQLMEQLRAVGLPLSRRTIVKYRKQLKINTAPHRKLI